MTALYHWLRYLFHDPDAVVFWGILVLLGAALGIGWIALGVA